MSLDYGWEKFYAAVSSLAASADSLQDRLANVWISHLIHLNPDEDLPEERRGEFREMKARVTRETGRAGEGSIAATTRLITDKEARQMIERICSIYDAIAREKGPRWSYAGAPRG
jgi:hypothetical protein